MLNAPGKLWTEFKNFAFKGNMIDLAVAVVIGAAFSTVINSLVKNVFMPAISYVAPGKDSYTKWVIGRIEIGQFIGEVVNFIVIALAVFLVIVKLVGAVTKKSADPAPPSAPTVRECPFCLSNIPVKAIKCAHCTADVAPAA